MYYCFGGKYNRRNTNRSDFPSISTWSIKSRRHFCFWLTLKTWQSVFSRGSLKGLHRYFLWPWPYFGTEHWQKWHSNLTDSFPFILSFFFFSILLFLPFFALFTFFILLNHTDFNKLIILFFLLGGMLQARFCLKILSFNFVAFVVSVTIILFKHPSFMKKDFCSN